MALEISTAGISVGYAVEATAGTRPTTGYTNIPNLKQTPDLNAAPSSLEVTDLSDLVWRRYIPGLRGSDGALQFTANLTSAFKTAWTTLVTAATTAYETGKLTWFEIKVPTIGSFYVAGIPCELGINSMDVDAVAEQNVYITPNKWHGWDEASA